MAPALVELKEIRGGRQHDRHRSTGEVVSRGLARARPGAEDSAREKKVAALTGFVPYYACARRAPR